MTHLLPELCPSLVFHMFLCKIINTHPKHTVEVNYIQQIASVARFRKGPERVGVDGARFWCWDFRGGGRGRLDS